MNSATSFGDSVIAEADKLRASGLDANQIAGILCKKDPQGKNYGIGILLGSDGKPMPTSPTLLEYVEKELNESGAGNYFNSDLVKKDILEATLRWQGVPESAWSHFQLLLPSDAGTGAVQTAIQVALLFKNSLQTLAVEELGWPAYKTIAAAARLGFQEYKTNGIAEGATSLPLYQAGPMNTTGRVPSLDVVKARAAAAKASGTPVVLDRAYSGFEYARRLGVTPAGRKPGSIVMDPPLTTAGDDIYKQIMKDSFQNQIQPFMDAGVPFALALSPTKAFVTFALRPCGLLLVYHPDIDQLKAFGPKLSGLIRARGSSFEHPITRAFVKALIKDRARLEAEHAAALTRTAQAELAWFSYVKGTAIEPLFSDAYAGLFRNPLAAPNASQELYGAHIYPVFAEGRCRLNVTGLPADPAQAAALAAMFAQFCRL